MELTKEQLAILDWPDSPARALAIRAYAGTGKTHQLELLAKGKLTGYGYACCFNKHSRDHLLTRLGEGFPIKPATIHQIGLSLLNRFGGRRFYIPQGRHKMTDWMETTGLPWKERTKLRRYAEIARLSLTFVNQTLLQNYLLDMGEIPSEETLSWVPKYIDQSRTIALATGKIDFADMLFLPWSERLEPSPVDWLLIDECQDLNALQIEMLKLLLGKASRIIAVGDPYQAIQAFACALADSYDRVRDEFQAEEMPLSVCWRCPTSHLELAQQIVPGIQPRPSAPVGSIVYSSMDAYSPRPGELILCRQTRPLIPLCMSLIKRGIQARIRGLDYGKAIATIVRDAKTIGNIDSWVAHLEANLTAAKAPPNSFAILHDKADCIHAVLALRSFATTEDLANYIEYLFSDGDSTIVLSTVHRAKGLEADRVAILYPDLLGNTNPDNPTCQEDNIHYVALTRSKDVLTFIEK